MAKEIPYFKFFTGEWSNGDITAENYKTQGVFINICAIYWTKEGKVSEVFIRKKIKDNKSIDDLIDSDIIKVDNGFLLICFLDEQLTETENIRKKNSEAGKESARKRALNKTLTPVERPLDLRSTETQPLREEKRREEKKREDKKETVFFAEEPLDFKFKEFIIFRKELKKTMTKTSINKSIKLLKSHPVDIAIQMLEQSMLNGWQGIFELKNNNNGKQSTNNQPKLHGIKSFEAHYEQNGQSDEDYFTSELARKEAEGLRNK